MISAVIKHQRTRGRRGGVTNALVKEEKKLVFIFSFDTGNLIRRQNSIKPGFMLTLQFVASF